MLPPARLIFRYAMLTISVIAIINFLYLWRYGAHLPDDFLRRIGGHGDAAKEVLFVKSSFDWGGVTPHFPVSSMVSLPSGTPSRLPRVQCKFKSESQLERLRLDNYRLEVKQAFQKCWSSYRSYAWTNDELTPVTGRGKDTFAGWRATLVDSLDTLFIMKLETEFNEAVEAVASIDFAKTSASSANMFETTIRYLGGLLSAYDLSKQEVLLLKATEIGDLLYAGFDTPNRLPGYWVDFLFAKTGKLIADTSIPLASPCTLSLEFTRLSQLTKDPKYYDAINRIALLLESNQNLTKLPGMWPVYLDFKKIDLRQDNFFSLGGDSDSAYEYLPKMHQLLGGLDEKYAPMTQTALDTIMKNLLFRPMLPDEEDILFAGSAKISKGGSFYINAEIQHLSCFTGGMFALSGRLFNNEKYLETGAKLTKGCIWAYNAFPKGIMPEAFSMLPCLNATDCKWDAVRWKNNGGVNLPNGVTNVDTRDYLLRPEAIESVFILYRITGKKEYQEAAWKMFKSIMAATETRYGNSAIADVLAEGETKKTDSMESFWLAETLKYFYLIFSPPDQISLDDYVFNTEAHPLQRLK